VQAFARCFAVLVQQPIGIENPTVLLESELASAVKDCRAAVTADPHYLDGWAGLALALAIRGDDAEAVKALAQASAGKGYLPLRWVAQFWLVTRYQSSAAGAGVLREAVAAMPGQQLLRGYLAEHLNAMDDQAGALAAWQAYADLCPANPFVISRLGYTLARLAKAAEGVTRTQEALKLDPTSRSVRLELGGRLVDAGRLPEAVAALQPLAQAPGAPAEAVLRLGFAHLQQKNLDQAEPLFQRALVQASRPSEWRTRGRADLDLAKVALRRGQRDRAVGFILEALREGYKPLNLQRDDPDLTGLAQEAEKKGASAAPANPSQPRADLAFHPKEASPFAVASSGEISPDAPRPPPPEGFEVFRFGPR
jgi:predicted Zn-dependent protease